MEVEMPGQIVSYFRDRGIRGVALTHFVASTLAITACGVFFIQSAVAAPAVTAPLNPKQVPQFVNLLPNPLSPGFTWSPDSSGGSTYTLQVEQFTQSLGLGAGIPATTVWGYGKADQPATFPGRTFELDQGTGITVTYENKLINPAANTVLPNLFPVDTTLDWANPGAVGGVAPVPAVSHLHGGDSDQESDGGPDGWGTSCAYFPATSNCSTAINQKGSFWKKDYTYDNLGPAGTLWYHDHALGITRTNVYAGLAGFYIMRDTNEKALSDSSVLPAYPYEVPIVIQDRLFTADGQLFYPSKGQGNLPNPTHLPEFFGDVLLVNGQAWPKLAVEPRKYRLRLLNGSDSRFYDLRFEYFRKESQIKPGAGTPVPFLVIGNELGLLNTPATPELIGAPGVLPIGPGERYDVLVDFTEVPMGTRVIATNSARSPYPNAARVERNLIDRLMAFDVNQKLSSTGASVGVGTNLRPGNPLPAPDTSNVAKTRQILLFEGTDVFGRLQTMLGVAGGDPNNLNPAAEGTFVFKDPITETPMRGTTEIWEFYNATVDAHPMHIHEFPFRVLDRQAFTGVITPKVNTDQSNGAYLTNIVKGGVARTVAPFESGVKDTVITLPGEVTRVLIKFDRVGQYVYHCHILSHEDHEMMRPYEVQQALAR
jgi:spore coat protein A